MKNRINEIKKKKHLKEWNKQYLDDTEEQISELEETAVEITEAKQKKIKRNEYSLKPPAATPNLLTFTLQGLRRKREKVSMNIFEDVIFKNIPNLEKEINKYSGGSIKSQTGSTQRCTILKWQILKIKRQY